MGAVYPFNISSMPPVNGFSPDRLALASIIIVVVLGIPLLLLGFHISRAQCNKVKRVSAAAARAVGGLVKRAQPRYRVVKLPDLDDMARPKEQERSALLSNAQSKSHQHASLR
jgi:hypothetical protein